MFSQIFNKIKRECDTNSSLKYNWVDGELIRMRLDSNFISLIMVLAPLKGVKKGGRRFILYKSNRQHSENIKSVTKSLGSRFRFRFRFKV